MTTFTYKILATIFMFIDHLAASFQLSDNGLITYETLFFMRAMGRVSLPIFAYFLVVSYGKTSNLNKYISRLHLGAIISQVPFSLLFSQNVYADDPITIFTYNYKNILFIGLIILSYYMFLSNRKFSKDLFIVSLAWILSPLNIVYKGIYIFNPVDLNIFYELGISLIIISLLDKSIKIENLNLLNILFAIISILGISYYVDMAGNYGFSVILLVILLFVFKDSKYKQSFIIILWGWAMYSMSLLNLIFVLITGFALLFYNGRKGKGMKHFFYIFYPLHIIFLIVLRIIILKFY